LPLPIAGKAIIVGALVDQATNTPLAKTAVFCSEFRVDPKSNLAIAFVDPSRDPSTKTNADGTYTIQTVPNRKCMVVASGHARVGQLAQITTAVGAKVDSVELASGQVLDMGVARLPSK
jgi:hypothetical protein